MLVFLMGEELMTYPRFVIDKRQDAGPEGASHPAHHVAVLPSSLLFIPSCATTVTTDWVAAGGKSLCLSFQAPSILSPSGSRLLQ